jgi:hypothetical protein
MKRLVSTALAVALLVSLGALAVLARGGGEILSPAGNAVAAAAPDAPMVVPDAVEVTLKVNEIALPLDVQNSFAVSGLPFTADGLARNISSGLSSVSQVTHWNASLQQNDTWTPTGPGTGYGYYNGGLVTAPWALQTGQAYRLVLKPGAATVYSIVGDVPALGAIHYTWVGGSGTLCKSNSFLVPLDQEQSVSGKDLSDADKLATNIGRANIAQVSRWNATLQQADTWTPTGTSGGYGYVNGTLTSTAFPVSPGYSYRICAKSGLQGVSWP